MGISYAGVNLLLEDDEGELREYLDQFLATEDGRMIVDWNYSQQAEKSFSGTSAACYSGQSLPKLNYSKPQEPRLSVWYQPTGASRWSFGLFICDSARLQQIKAAITNTAGSPLILQSLASGKNTQSTRTFNAYMLPCHVISADASNSASLWLVPLVDERYFWQFATAQLATPINNTSPTANTWAATITGDTALFGAIQQDVVPSAYLRPNYFFLSGPASYSLSPVAIDLLLHSIGQRLVPNYPAPSANTVFAGQNWKAINFTSTQALLTTNLAGLYDQGFLQAGSVTVPGFFNQQPSQIVVNFRAWKNGIVQPDWLQSRYQKTLNNANGNTAFIKSINSTALADYSTGGGNPDNQASLDALATQIATDYIASLQWIQDSVILGVSQWQESGYDDFIEFDVGYREPESGEYACHTRIHSIPYDFGSEIQFHYDSTTWEYGDKIYGTLDGALAANGNQTITLTGADGPIPSGTTHIKVFEVLGNSVSAGTKVYALRMGSKWVVDVGDGTGATTLSALIVATCAAVTTAGNSATFTSVNTAGTYTALVRSGLCLPAVDYLVTATDGGTYEVVNPDRIVYGQFAGGPVKAGTTGTLTIFSGALGSETTTGVTVSGVEVRRGFCDQNRTYMVGYTTGGWEVLNPDGMLLCQCATLTDCSGGATITAKIYSGTQGSESDSGLTVSAYVRKGIIHTTQTYQLSQMVNGFEVLNPSLTFRGKPGADIASDASGSMVIWTGTGAGSASGTTVSSIRNDTSCTVKQAKFAYAEWCDSLNGWAFDIFHSS